MAWVHLSDLFAEDKNFHGLLNPILDKPVFVRPCRDGLKYLQDSTLALFEKDFSKSVKLESIFGTWMDAPEWDLDSNGCLINFTGALYEVKGNLRPLYLFKIDVSGMLKAFITRENLLIIGEILSCCWRNSGSITVKTKEFEYASKYYSKDHVVNVEKFEEFVKNVIEKGEI